jgi:hypothetical protein
MPKVTARIEVAFETNGEPQARAALIRIQGDLTHSIEHGAMGSAMITGIVPGTVRVTITDKMIDGKPVS